MSSWFLGKLQTLKIIKEGKHKKIVILSNDLKIKKKCSNWNMSMKYNNYITMVRKYNFSELHLVFYIGWFEKKPFIYLHFETDSILLPSSSAQWLA